MKDYKSQGKAVEVTNKNFVWISSKNSASEEIITLYRRYQYMYCNIKHSVTIPKLRNIDEEYTDVKNSRSLKL
jgi:hypothetical protein